jgi:phosphatidylglycerol lysyltransferase
MPARIRPHIVHRLVAALVVLGGVFDLLDGLWTRHPVRLNRLAEWLPLEVHQGSRALLVLSGLILIGLGRGLGRGKRRAWQLAVVMAGVSLLLHLLRNRHLGFILPPLALLLYLLVAHTYFIAGSDPASVRRALAAAPWLFCAVLTYGTLGQYHLRRVIDPPFRLSHAMHATLRASVGADQVGVEPQTRHAREFLDSIAWLSIGSCVVLVWLCLRPVILRQLDPALPAAERLVREYGSESLAAFASEPDKYHFLAAEGRAAIAYRVVSGVAIAAGDPIGPPQATEAAIDEFLAYCRRHDWTPCFYEVGSRYLDLYRQRGMRSLKIAEEAVIPLEGFSLRGTKLQKVRQAINKIEREHSHLKVEFYDGLPPEEIEDELQWISEQWLKRKGIHELGFTMGRYDPAALASQKLAVAVEDGRVVGFVSWRPFSGKGLALDLMRYAPDPPKFVMDFLIAQSLLEFQKQGYKFASLANAPLANVSPEDQFSKLDRGVRLIFDNVHGIYEYKSLFQFKKKFNPQWQGRYLVFPSLDALPRIGVAMLRVHRQPPLPRALLGAT